MAGPAAQTRRAHPDRLAHLGDPVNVDTLLAAMPGLSRNDATRYLPLMEAAMAEYQITSEMRSRMWLAQVGHESLSLKYFEEIASGAAYEGRKDLGNTQPGDGEKYKGRGPIQITGRYNYDESGRKLKLPLIDQPKMAADPPHAFRVSAEWWKSHGLNEISDTGDVVAATKRINGGTNGLSDRQSRYELARKLGPAVIVGAVASDGDETPAVAYWKGQPYFAAIWKDGRVCVKLPGDMWRAVDENSKARSGAGIAISGEGRICIAYTNAAGKACTYEKPPGGSAWVWADRGGELR
jgi:predicted chitinase